MTLGWTYFDLTYLGLTYFDQFSFNWEFIQGVSQILLPFHKVSKHAQKKVKKKVRVHVLEEGLLY